MQFLYFKNRTVLEILRFRRGEELECVCFRHFFYCHAVSIYLADVRDVDQPALSCYHTNAQFRCGADCMQCGRQLVCTCGVAANGNS